MRNGLSVQTSYAPTLFFNTHSLKHNEYKKTYALGHNGALRDQQHVLGGELLLELAHDALIDLLKLLVQAERDKDNERLLVVAEFDLLDGRDVQVLQVGCQVLGRVLQVRDGLSSVCVCVCVCVCAGDESMIHK